MIDTKIFHSFLNNHNRIIGFISFKELLHLPIQLPIVQRLKDNDKIKEIIDYQESYFKKHSHFNFLNNLSIHYCQSDGIYYLTDGQHRYEAIRELSKTYNSNTNLVSLEIIQVNTKQDYEENYSILNKNTPLPDFPDTIEKDIPENCFLHFEQTYPKVWTQSNRPQRPFMNKNHFQEAVGFLTEKLQTANLKPSSDMLIQLIEDKNKLISQWSSDEFCKIKKINDPEKMKQKCIMNGGCYLGMIPHISDRYGFEWIKDIVKDKTGVELQKEKKINPKKKIGIQRKREVWNTHIGVDKGQTKCWCCKQETLDQGGGWEAGHWISTANLLKDGKEDDISVSNLRPICSTCNKSMGSQNMQEYIKQNYPQNSTWFTLFKH